VTASGSGLDPDISPADAALQIHRIARTRGLAEGRVKALVEGATKAPQLGFLGEARVSVLDLNLALDRASGR
jgi:K+-transporting ATPase ATPase C chain